MKLSPHGVRMLLSSKLKKKMILPLFRVIEAGFKSYQKQTFFNGWKGHMVFLMLVIKYISPPIIKQNPGQLLHIFCHQLTETWMFLNVYDSARVMCVLVCKVKYLFGDFAASYGVSTISSLVFLSTLFFKWLEICGQKFST